MVVDTSVLLAVLFAEEHGTWAAERLNEFASELCMSTVNLAETLILIRDRQPERADELTEIVFAGGMLFVPPDAAQARLAAHARLAYPLNLGDCFAYALAVVRNDTILTMDTDFKATDRPVLLPNHR